MRKKLVQLIIALVGTALICLGAVSGTAEKPAPKQDENTGQQGDEKEPSKESIPEEEALAQVQPEAYRSVEGLAVPEGTRISVLMREGESGFAELFEKGCRRACDDLNETLGYTGKDKVKLSCSAPSKSQSISGQGAILDEELNLYPDVMAVSLVDAVSCEVQFDLARDNGVSIIGFDAVPAYEHIAGAVGMNNAQAAAEAADHLKEALAIQKRTGSVMIFADNATASNLQVREEAFMKQLGDQFPVSCIYHMTDLEAKRAEAAAALTAADENGREVLPEDLDQEEVIAWLFDTNPDVAGVFVADELTAEKVLRVMAEKGVQAKVTAFGSYEDLAHHALAQQLVGTIMENPYGMGYATAAAALRIAAGAEESAKADAGYIWQPAAE